MSTENADLMDALRDYVGRRLDITLKRFGDQIRRIRVEIDGLNGPRGGLKKSCRITAELKPNGRLAVEEVDPDLYSAMDRATARLGRLFAHHLKRMAATRFGGKLPQAA